MSKHYKSLKHRRVASLTIQNRAIAKRKSVYGTFYLCFMVALSIPVVSIADDHTDCMTKMMLKASDSTTMGELRQNCEQQIKEKEFTVEEKDTDIDFKRLKEAKRHILQPFTLMAHKPNFFILGKYNSVDYNAKPYQEHFDDASLELENTETQFQISIKTPLAIGLWWDIVDIYAAYTNRSFWQVYKTNSEPFRETNHEPEGWVQFNPGWESWGFTMVSNSIGVVHQSNGRGGELSRSWNRIYANFLLEKGNFALSVKPWYWIPEEDEKDDNPDITDFLGHYEIRAAYKWRGHLFGVMSRNNLESGFSKGAVELSWSFPIFDYPYFSGYIQYFSGYGESLITITAIRTPLELVSRYQAGCSV